MAVEQVPDEGGVWTRFAINRDVTFSGTLAVNGSQVWRYSGTRSLQGNRITRDCTASGLVLLAEDHAGVDELLAADGTVLRYRVRAGVEQCIPCSGSNSLPLVTE